MSRTTSYIVGVLVLLVGITGIAVALLVPSGASTTRHQDVALPSGGVTVTESPQIQQAAAPKAKRSTPPPSAGPITSTPPVDATATNLATPSTVGAKGPGRHIKVHNPDGCNRAYGTSDQCIPKRQPGGTKVTCAYLTKQGFFAVPLVIRGDPLHLMRKPHVVMYTDTLGRMVIASCSDS